MGKQQPYQLHILLDDSERQLLEAKASDAGMTMSRFVRQHIGRVQVVNRDDAKRHNWLLANIANNLNQLARYANRQKSAVDALTIHRGLIDIERQVAKMTEAQ